MIKKILCGLIIGFGLLSFSSAFDIPGIGLYGNSTVVLSENYDITTTWKGIDTFNGFYTEYAYNSSNIDRYGFGWIDGQLYMVSFSRNGQNVYSRQGFFDTYCLADLNGTCNNFTSPISEFYLAMQNGFNSFTIYRGTSFRESLIFCFGNDTNNYCLGISPRVSGNIQSSTTGDLNFDINYLSFESFQNISWGNSPYSSSSVPSIPDYEFDEDDTYTNKQIIEGYNAMGLTDDFCYGGFDIDNIFEAGTVPQEFTGYRWGGGAFIFDIWDIYSGAYNNDYISFLRSFYISYENNNYSDFYGKTKALYGFINQWFSVSSKGLGFIESTAPTFTLVDVWQYCDLRFNQDPDSIYTGDRRNPKFRYYTSGQVNLGGYFNFSGNNNYFSGNLSGFNTPKDFFASLNSIFQGGLNNLENREPVLPTYIIVFFLAIIFIRIISH